MCNQDTTSAGAPSLIQASGIASDPVTFDEGEPPNNWKDPRGDSPPTNQEILEYCSEK
jgi:hypothetical protein